MLDQTLASTDTMTRADCRWPDLHQTLDWVSVYAQSHDRRHFDNQWHAASEQYLMVANGFMYVANNYNYYWGRGGDSAWRVYENNTTNFQINADGNCTARATFSCSGVRTIFNNLASYGFNFRWDGTYIYGRVDNVVDLGISNNSDERLKTDIAPSTFDCLEAILKTPLYQFRWRDGRDTKKLFSAEPRVDAPTVRVGFVAQRQYEVFPESVMPGGEIGEGAEGATRIWGMDSNVMMAALCGAVQQLTTRIEALEAASVSR